MKKDFKYQLYKHIIPNICIIIMLCLVGGATLNFNSVNVFTK